MITYQLLGGLIDGHFHIVRGNLRGFGIEGNVLPARPLDPLPVLVPAGYKS